MKKVPITLFVVAFVLTLLGGASAQKRPILIDCPSGSASITPDTLRIMPAEYATFTATFAPGSDTCADSVRIVGGSPINTVWLTHAVSTKAVQFSVSGLYSYVATNYSGSLPQPPPDTGWVRVRGDSGIPTMTGWGVIILTGLLICSAVLIMLRRRKSAVPA